MSNIQQELDELNLEIASENNKCEVKKGGNSRKCEEIEEEQCCWKRFYLDWRKQKLLMHMYPGRLGAGI